MMKKTNKGPCIGLKIIILLIIAAGCSTPKTDISDVFHYNFSLISPPTGTLSFEDKDIRFTFEPEEDDIKILLENRGTYPIKINWEKSSYVDNDGISHHLVTKKVKYEDKDKPQEPTVINPKSGLTEWIMPADNIDRSFLVWKIKPMFPELKTPATIDTWDRTTFKVMLPVEINGEPKNYEFVFKVKTR